MRECSECGAKLSHRNPQRKVNGKYSFRKLCQPCFNYPKDEDRCIALTAKGKRCKLRRLPESKKNMCAMHRR
jgi:hypothetical protein